MPSKQIGDGRSFGRQLLTTLSFSTIITLVILFVYNGETDNYEQLPIQPDANARIDSLIAEIAFKDSVLTEFTGLTTMFVKEAFQTHVSLAKLHGIEIQEQEGESLTPFNKDDWK